MILQIEDLLRSFDDKGIPVMVSRDGVSKKFYSLYSAAKYMDVSLANVKYSYSKGKDTVRKRKGDPKVSYLKWS